MSGKSWFKSVLRSWGVLLLALLVVLPRSCLFGQETTHRDGPDIARLRWIDDSGRQPVSYVQWKAATGPQRAFQIELAGKSRAEAATADGVKFCIIVNSALQTQVQGSLDVYVGDLTAEGYEVETYATSGGTPADIRAFLQGRYALGLVGCVLIGDLPIPWYEAECWEDPVEHEEFPCDLFYMDLNGMFHDADMDGLYDYHDGDVAPEIWVGRLTASPLTLGGANEVSLIQNYFAKNHDYRAGTTVLNNRALVYIDDDWVSSSTWWDENVGLAYANRTFVNDEYTTWSPDFKARLPLNWESILVCGHSSPWTQYFHNPDDDWSTITNNEVRTIDPVAYFYNLFACSHARYVETDYSAGWYAFNATYGLVSIGSTKTGSMLDFEYFYGPFGTGVTIGEAFKQWFTDIIYGENYEDWQVCWHFGMTMIGDPTLRKSDAQSDMDRDGVVDGGDNCPVDYNPGQEDTDSDSYGDICDPDDDNDGVLDAADTNPLNPDVCADADADGCDDCAVGTDNFGPMADNLPNNDGADTDADGICNSGDNCPWVSNPEQVDSDLDGIGNDCAGVYCDATGTTCPPSGGALSISEFQIGEVSNVSGCDGYHDYGELGALCNVYPDSSYDFHVFSEGNSGSLVYYVRVWIDWNRNYQFSDDGEGYAAPYTGDGSWAGVITVPANALLEDEGAAGKTVLRLRLFMGAEAAPDPIGCYQLTFGEVEDYELSVTCADFDQDGICDNVDNCQGVYNPDQADSDGDEIGDACETCCLDRVGDANNSLDDEPTIGDIGALISALFLAGTCDGVIQCMTEADLNQSGGLNPVCEDITISDIGVLISYLFINGPWDPDTNPTGTKLNNCL